MAGKRKRKSVNARKRKRNSSGRSSDCYSTLSDVSQSTTLSVSQALISNSTAFVCSKHPSSVALVSSSGEVSIETLLNEPVHSCVTPTVSLPSVFLGTSCSSSGGASVVNQIKTSRATSHNFRRRVHLPSSDRVLRSSASVAYTDRPTLHRSTESTELVDTSFLEQYNVVYAAAAASISGTSDKEKERSIPLKKRTRLDLGTHASDNGQSSDRFEVTTGACAGRLPQTTSAATRRRSSGRPTAVAASAAAMAADHHSAGFTLMGDSGVSAVPGSLSSAAATVCSVGHLPQYQSLQQSAPLDVAFQQTNSHSVVASAANAVNLSASIDIVMANAAFGSAAAAAAAGSVVGSVMAPLPASHADELELDMSRLRNLFESRGIPLGAFPPRVHQLLQNRMSSHSQSAGRAQQLLTALESPDETVQLAGLAELSNMLAMGNEDSLAGFPVKQVVPAIIVCIRHPNNEVVNKACQALHYLLEALPRSSAHAVEAVPALLEKLQSLEVIDIAEQVLAALEKLSLRHGKAIVHAGGLAAVLYPMDFFFGPSLYKALNVLANCFQHMTPLDVDQVRGSLAALSERLKQHDQKMVERVCLCFCRLVDTFRHDEKLLKLLAAHDLFVNVQNLLTLTPALIDRTTFEALLRMLATMCAHCPDLAVALVRHGIVDTIRFLILGQQLVSTTCTTDGTASSSEATAISMNGSSICTASSPPIASPARRRSQREMLELANLAAELLPPLPAVELFSIDETLSKLSLNTGSSYSGFGSSSVNGGVEWQWQDNRGIWHSYLSHDNMLIESAFQSGKDELSLDVMDRHYNIDLNSWQQVNEDTGTQRPMQRKQIAPPAQAVDNTCDRRPDGRADMFCEEPALASSLMRMLSSLLLETAAENTGWSVRARCLNALLRLLHPATAQLLQLVLCQSLVSSHLAALLACTDLRVLTPSLQIAHILLGKLPGLFQLHFRREGVLFQMQRLANGSHPIFVVARGAAAAAVSSSSATASPCSSASLGSSGLPPPPPPSLSASATKLTDVIMKRKRINKAARRKQVSSPTTRGHSNNTTTLDVESKSDTTCTTSSSTGSMTTSTTNRRRQYASSNTSSTTPLATSRFSAKMSSLVHSLNPTRWSRSSHVDRNVGAGSAAYLLNEGGAGTCDSSSTGGVGGSEMLASIEEQVRSWVRAEAARLVTLHFTQQQQQQLLDSPTSAIVASSIDNNDYTSIVNAASSSSIPCGGAAAEEVLKQLVMLGSNLQAQENVMRDLCSLLVFSDVSLFEIQHSGIVGRLLSFLAGEEAWSQQANRLRHFAAAFLDLPVDNSASRVCAVNANCDALRHLVGRLLACLHQTEQFVVRVHGDGSPVQLFNNMQFKCQLMRHPETGAQLPEWRGPPVKIDPLAQVQAVERYLLVRGYGKPGASPDTDDDGSDVEESAAEDAVAAVIAGASGGRHRLQLLLGNHVLPYNMTVYQAIRQYSSASSSGLCAVANNIAEDEPDLLAAMQALLEVTHVIYYRPCAPNFISSCGGGGGSCGNNSNSVEAITVTNNRDRHHSRRSYRRDELWIDGTVPHFESPLARTLSTPLTAAVTSLSLSQPVCELLALLRILHVLSSHWHCLYDAPLLAPAPSNQHLLNDADFYSAKLTSKATRQLQDSLAVMTGSLPSWLPQLVVACPFLFPLQTRQLVFFATCLDRERAMLRLHEVTAGASNATLAENGHERLGSRLSKDKRTVARGTDLLRSAERLLEEVAGSSNLLEVSFETEEGSGLGPTLEFYSLVSRELQRADLELWRGERDQHGYVLAPPGGLYPTPLARSAKQAHVSRIKAKFRFLGRLLGKALLDGRQLDLPLCSVLYRWIVQAANNQDSCSSQMTLSWTLADMWLVDSGVARSLVSLEGVLAAKRLIEQDDSHTAASRELALEQLGLDGCPIEDLGLDFTLPGYPTVELLKGGRDIAVRLDNLESYISLVRHWTLSEGIHRQVEALKEGLDSVLSSAHLRCFYPEEMDQVFCGAAGAGLGAEEEWCVRTLSEACRPDHGYSHDSRAIRFLFDIMSAFSHHERRSFLQFVTGSPRLPVGGFKSLNPNLKIVEKKFDADENQDNYLPSVMTCYNYLKLPDYSTLEVMREKLLLAMTEGQLAFHLS